MKYAGKLEVSIIIKQISIWFSEYWEFVYGNHKRDRVYQFHVAPYVYTFDQMWQLSGYIGWGMSGSVIFFQLAHLSAVPEYWG